MRVQLSLGSNLGDASAHLCAGIQRLDATENIRVCAVSHSYETEPVGVEKQPPFLNMAVEIETALLPLQLLETVKAIESEVGRTETFRWGPRILDIDLILWEQRVLQEEQLTLPHAEFRTRAFVLTPMAEIRPCAVDPVTGKTVFALTHVSRVTVAALQARKIAGEKIAMLTAYDYPTAKLLDESNLDAILVGDSLGMTVMGHEDTLSVTTDDVVYHARMVARAATRAMVVADMPFLSYQVCSKEAVRNAGRLVAEGGAQAVKLEGAANDFGEAIGGILRAGIPVMGHLGLTPQSVHKFSGFKVQGREAAQRVKLKSDAKRLEDIGCFAVVLECIPADLAHEVTESLSIPTIGIGAGIGCDGQILVVNDILGWGKTRFGKIYADVRGQTAQAVDTYVQEVRGESFPGEEHSYR
jgi:3-methyl-2-oxobutanoate hydroxymethyltransferase